MPTLHESYMSLPSLQGAAKGMNGKKGLEFIKGPLRRLFQEYDMSQKYGVRLLPRHFDMKPTERPVEAHRNSFPITLDGEDPAVDWL
jgi:hypothetical protein